GMGAFVVLLIISASVDFAMGWVVSSGVAAGNRTQVRLGVAGSVGVNLALLGYFKYANFFVEQFNTFGQRFGFEQIAWTSIILPIGISFYTFQSMSYTLDLSRGRAERVRNPVDFAVYVTMFPQLVAGPIVRFHEISAQLINRSLSLDRFALGATRFAHGLAKKVLIGDAVAPIVDAAFAADPLTMSPVAAWLGIAAFTIQIYFDFSGYTDMAIGMGMMLGFDFPENFRRPYSAVSMTDFWRRWHITLSNWFRDYLYIPLGGSRGTKTRTMVNLWIVFLLVGLWHGAAWTFILWGAYNGLLLAAERATGQRPVGDDDTSWVPLRRASVLFLVMVGWVIFRSPTVAGAMDYIGAMFTSGGVTPDSITAVLDGRAMIAMAIGVASVLLPGTVVGGLILTKWRGIDGTVARVAEMAVVFPLALIAVASGTFSPFLYYQF
ncbi:MAG: MBOAT family protein, partial [Actinomycetota bacterium]|nr:MBOAT family protein [Actinomycetota bacterium]